MRVVFVGLGDFYHHPGMKQLYNFANAFCLEGNQAQMLIAGNASTAAVMSAPPYFDILEMSLQGPLLSKSIAHRVKDFRPDIIHALTFRHVPALIGWQLKRQTGAPLVIYHEDDEEFLARQYWNQVGKRFSPQLHPLVKPVIRLRNYAETITKPQNSNGSVRHMTRIGWSYELVKRSCDGHIAISPSLACWVGSEWPDQSVSVLYPGTDLTIFSPARSGAEVRRALDLEAQQALVYSGSMNQTIIQCLVQMLAVVATSYPDTTLVLLGNDSLESFAQSEASRMGVQSNLRFVGLVPYSEVPNYLAAADILVQHAVDLGNEYRLPAKLPEYLAMGKPLVTYSQGSGQLLEEGVHALKIHTSDPAELASRVIELIENPSLAQQLGDNARRLAIDLFDWQKCGHRLVSVYESVLSTQRAIQSDALGITETKPK